MKILVENKDKNKIIYQITCCVGPHLKEYHYIGYTKRTLEKRLQEHLFTNTAVTKFIKINDVRCVRAEVLEECEYEQLLDSAETRHIANYILKRGTKANKRNHLINIDLKGLNRYTLKNVKSIYNKLQFN